MITVKLGQEAIINSYVSKRRGPRPVVKMVSPYNWLTDEYNERGHRELLMMERKFDEWLVRIDEIPQPYQTLTEEEWTRVCHRFNSCALCGNEEITTRGMFIPFDLGGRYCDWNVIPMCDRCAKYSVTQKNPWRRMNRLLNTNLDLSNGNPKKFIGAIVDYLNPIMEARISGHK